MSVLDPEASLRKEPADTDMPRLTPSRKSPQWVRRLFRAPSNVWPIIRMVASHPRKIGFLGTVANEYGVPVGVARCLECGNTFTVTPSHDVDWTDPRNLVCLAPPPKGCTSYDPHRDASFLFGDPS